jgi:hypothetical protein
LRDDVAISSTLPRHCEERSDVARGRMIKELKDKGKKLKDEILTDSKSEFSG